MVEIVKDNTDVNKVRRRLVDIKLAFKESMDREVSRIFEEIEDLDTEIQEGMSDLPVVEADYITRMDAKTAVDLLARVDDQYRAVVALFYLEDYSYCEIAEVLGIPLGTVKSRLARGVAQLKDLVLHSTRRSAARKEEL